MKDLSKKEIAQLGGFSPDLMGDSFIGARALGTDVDHDQDAFIGTAFVGGPRGQVPRALLRPRKGELMAGPFGQVPRAMPRPQKGELLATHYVSGPEGQVPRAILRPGKGQLMSDFYIGGPQGQVPRAILRPGKGVLMADDFISGPQGQVPRAILRPRKGELMADFAISGYETIVGARRKKHHDGWKKRCAKQLHEIKKAARSSSHKVPAGLINDCLTARKNAFIARHGKQPPAPALAKWKAALLHIVKKHGGQVDGPVVVVGDWLSSIVKIPGTVVSKAVELGVRGVVALPKTALKLGQTTLDTASLLAHGKVLQAGKKLGTGLYQSVKTMSYDPVKSTFFKPGAPKPPGLPPVAPPGYPPGALPPSTIIPPGYYTNPNIPQINLGPGAPPPLAIMPNTAALAMQIARRRSLTQSQATDLMARIETAKNRSRLADLERAEYEKVQQLEQDAAAAEAEAMQAEADVSMMDPEGNIAGSLYNPALSLLGTTGPLYSDTHALMGAVVREARVASFMGQAKEARIAQEVLKTAGEFAKLAILPTKWSSLFSGFRSIYNAAKADPKGPEKVAALKEAAKAGDKQAEKVVDVLKMGKKTDDQLKAVKVVETELNKAADKKAAESAGVMGAELTMIGMLPSSARVISTIPGAEMIYNLAKKGNKTMLDVVAMAADLLRKSEAGDQGAKTTIAEFGKRAKDGDKQGQLFMAAAAVAAAGIREEKALAQSKTQGVMGAAVAQAKRVQASPTAPSRFQRALAPAKAVYGDFRAAMDTLDAEQAVGIALKVARG